MSLGAVRPCFPKLSDPELPGLPPHIECLGGGGGEKVWVQGKFS